MSDPVVALVFGTRPEAIKLAPIYTELKRRSQPVRVIVTAQHRGLLDQMLAVFDMQPDVDLNIMEEGQTLSEVTCRALTGLQETFQRVRPDIVLVQGDTTTVLGGALAAFYERIPIGHVEAGLRTRDKFSPFPEEINRRLTSHMADVHLAPTRRARHNLQGEGLDPLSIFVTGNTIVDALLWVKDRAPDLAGTEYAWVDDLVGRTILTTIHRRENLGVPFTSICLALLELAGKYPEINIIFPMHPNPKVRAAAHELLGASPRIHLCEPPDYLHFVALMQRVDLLIVDSGGIQEEAPALCIPVLVVRETTERPEGIEAGVTRLVGTQTNTVVAAAAELLDNPSAYEAMASGANPYGDGRAAERVVGALEYFLGVRDSRPPDYDWRQEQ